MKLMVLCLSLTLVVGYLFGGRLRNVSSLRIRWVGLAMVGFALQFVTGPGDTVPLVCLYTSFVLLTVFAVRNIKVVGFPIVLFGIALNFTVIGLNAGMPVSGHALVASDQGELYDYLVHDPYPKHHLATSDDTFRFLGDVIPLPSPIAQAVSIGDVFTYGGVAVVIIAAMRTPAGREEDAPVLEPTDGEVEHAGS
ncbi:MAG: DUF5317 domain-containing protein [Actinomycetota bacterium]